MLLGFFFSFFSLFRLHNGRGNRETDHTGLCKSLSLSFSSGCVYRVHRHYGPLKTPEPLFTPVNDGIGQDIAQHASLSAMDSVLVIYYFPPIFFSHPTVTCDINSKYAFVCDLMSCI